MRLRYWLAILVLIAGFVVYFALSVSSSVSNVNSSVGSSASSDIIVSFQPSAPSNKQPDVSGVKEISSLLPSYWKLSGVSVKGGLFQHGSSAFLVGGGQSILAHYVNFTVFCNSYQRGFSKSSKGVLVNSNGVSVCLNSIATNDTVSGSRLTISSFIFCNKDKIILVTGTFYTADDVTDYNNVIIGFSCN